MRGNNDMEKIHVARLLKLANHLLFGKLAHAKFDFGSYNTWPEEEKNFCGTSGCAIGECPAIFSGWRWTPNQRVLFGCHQRTSDSGQEFFGLTHKEYLALFTPGVYREWASGELDENATRVQVAENIFEFLVWKAGQSQ